MTTAPFRIQLLRTGGVTGMTRTLDVRSERLDSAEADKVARWLEEADFSRCRESYPGPRGTADLFVYAITLSREGKSHTVKVTDLSVPASLVPILAWLKDRLSS